MPQKRTAAAPRAQAGRAPSLAPKIIPSAAPAPAATTRSARAAATRLELLLAADGLDGGPGEPALVAALAGWVDSEALAPEARAALVRLGLA
jgi:hypothetical protein